MPLRLAGRVGPAQLLWIALVAALLALAPPARAWVEVHAAADDVRLTIDRAGAARVEHRITLKISGGPLRALDVQGVDPDAAPEADAYVVPLKDAQARSLASASAVALELLPRDERPREDGSLRPPALRASFDGKGLSRGVYVLFFRYRTDLQKRGLVRREGALARVTWQAPIWEDGLDSARIVVDIPQAPTEPREAGAAPAAGAPAEGDAPPAGPLTLSTLRRGRERDELELVRPYAPKGEPIRWSILADARAFQPEEAAPAAAPRWSSLPVDALEAAAAWGPERRRTLYLAAGGLLFVLYSALVAAKTLEVARLCRAAGVAPRPLIPLPLPARAAAAGIALVAGLSLQLLLKTGTAGAALVALATALAAHRTPRWNRPVLRGPGKWLPVAEAEAFRLPPRPRGAYLDVTTRAGKVFLTISLAGVGAGVHALYGVSPYHAHLLAFDATALLAVFCTGRMAELPPDPAAAPVPFLRGVALRLKRLLKGTDARVVGRLRIPDRSPDADELRLGLAPRAPLPGFIGIEVGVAYAPGAGGAIALPEVLLRVTAGSPCEQAVERVAKSGRAVRGRRIDERVIAFAPRLPTARMTAAIAAALARAVTTAPAAEAAAKPAKARGRAKAAAAKPGGKKAVSAAA